MAFHKKTIRDINLHGKTVLLRADYNVPIDDGKIGDDYRIKQSLPTVRYLLEQDCKLIICSHLGRPDGKPNAKESLAPVAKRLSELLDKSVAFVGDCIGPQVEKAVAELKPGHVLLLENLRFHPEEEKNDHDFAKQLARLAEVFVQDGFGVVHRAHASTDAVTKFLPSVAGLLLEKEVDTITRVMERPEHPLVAIIGGAKIADKIEILNRLIDTADFVAIGGAMANTFLLAEGYKVGKSLVETEDLELARDITERAQKKMHKQPFTFLIPRDVVVSTDLDGKKTTRIVDITSYTTADIEAYPRLPSVRSHSVLADELILDIGPFSAAMIAGATTLAKTAIWNGTLGVTEVEGINGAESPFEHGSKVVLEALQGEGGQDHNRPFSLIGGGDTAGYVMEHAELDGHGVPLGLGHVSTGGGASLELMSGKKLPGVEALLNKEGK